MGRMGQGTIFLMESVVKRIDILPNLLESKPEWKIGKLVVFVKFLQFTLEIEEDTKGNMAGKGEFRKGRSFLFSTTNLPHRSSLDVEFYVFRKRPDGVIPDKVTIGRTKLNFGCHFINIMKMSQARPQERPVCKALQDTLDICDVNDITTCVGTLTVIMRATCLGQLVVTQLRKFGENSILVKGTKDDALYECESITRNNRIPEGELLRDKRKIKTEQAEKSLEEEFKHILGGSKPISEEVCKNMMKPSTNRKSTLDDLAFIPFFDETNRLCVIYNKDECVTDPNVCPKRLETAFKVHHAGDDGGASGIKMLWNEPTQLSATFQPQPILKHGLSKEDTRNMAATNLLPSPTRGGRRGCKDCSRNTDQDFDYCPVYPRDTSEDREPTSNEKLGIKICEAECLPSPQLSSAKKEDRDEQESERIPGISPTGHALFLSRMKGATQKKEQKQHKPKRQPLKYLAPSKRPWEPDPNAPPEVTEPPETTAHFPPLQPYTANTDIHIRTPQEPESNVFLMKMLGKADQKPVLQLEVRTPRKLQPGDPVPQSPEPEQPPPPVKDTMKEVKRGKGKKGKKK